MAWNRELSSGLTTFGVSGFLYNANIIPYDRRSDSYWSQMRLECVGGELKGKQLDIEPHSNHFAFAWLAFHPDSEIYEEN